MKKMKLGKSGIEISSIIFGAWQAGKAYWTGISDSDIKKAIEVSIENGVDTFDTAEEYGDGESERLLGEILSKQRDQVKILSKVFSNHLNSKEVRASCEKSLNNLKTDFLDLYQIHWPSGHWGSKVVPIGETMDALNALREEGKIRSIGVSNFSLDELRECLRYGQIDSLQPPYSLLWRNIETGLQDFCLKNQITILAYSPMAQGFLTGRFKKDHRFEEGDHRKNNRFFQPNVFPKVIEINEKLRPLAEKRNLSLSQLCLSWVISHPNTAAIAGARNAEQARSNAKAGNIVLEMDLLKKMNEISEPVSSLFMQETVLWT